MSTQVAPDTPDIGQLLSDGWQSGSEGVGQHYCHNYKTGVRTELCPTPMAAFRAAAEMQAAASAKRPFVEPSVAEILPPREVFYMVTKGHNGRFMIDLCFSADEKEHDPDDASALIAAAEVGDLRVVSKHGLDMTDDEILNAVVADNRLIRPHDYRKEEPNGWCGVCFEDRGSILHPVSDEQLVAVLAMVDVEVSEEAVRGWTPAQRNEAVEWAGAVHFNASDNDDVEVPPRPEFLPPAGEQAALPTPTKTTYADPQIYIGMLVKARSLNEVEQIISGYQLLRREPPSVYVAPESYALIEEAVALARARFADVASFSPSDEVQESATLDPAPYVPDEFARAGVVAETKTPSGETKPASAETKMSAELLDPAVIRTDGGTQARAALNERTVAEYAERMLDGDIFPAVVVFYDGAEYWMGDGFHRLAATERAELAEIAAVVRQGTRRDAVLYAVGANASHGLPRTGADKRRAVETLLRDEEWSKWSNREVARQCGVSKGFVGDVREELTGERAPEEVKAVRGGREYTVNTSNLAGRKGESDDDGSLSPDLAGIPPEERSAAFDNYVAAHRDAPAEATPSGASQTSAPETGTTPTPSHSDEAGGAGTQPAAASVGAGIIVNDRRRIKPETAAAPAHPAARPDGLMERWVGIQKRLNGRGFYVSHSFLPNGLGYMVTVNLSGEPPTDALNSELFPAPASKVPFFFDSELDLIEKRLDAEKLKSKPSTKAPPKTAPKSSRKAAPAKKTDGPATCTNCSKRIKAGRTHTHTAKGKCAEYCLPFKVGDTVRVTDKSCKNTFGQRGEVTDINKGGAITVKIGRASFGYKPSQLTAEKKTATRGATKKTAKGVK